MGAKYTTIAATGYNSSPPADDGSQVAANLITWSGIKTKLGDPVKTEADAINTALVSAFDYSVRQITTSDSSVAGDHMRCIEIKNDVSTAVTISLGDATTMTNVYRVFIKNSSAIPQTLTRVTGGDTLDGVAASVVLAPGEGRIVQTNNAANGYLTVSRTTPFARGADIASATTTSLDSTTGDLVDVTGTTTITAITLADGKRVTVRFTGILTLTNGASLVLPGAANITTAAGDFAIFRGYAAGVVRCASYVKASGKAVINTANTQPTRTVLTSGSGTYTTPANATRINVKIWGPGGGGGASGTGAFGSAATSGGNTTFSTLTANGGQAGGTSTSLTFAAGGTASGGDINLSGMDGMASASVAFTAANSGDGGATSLGGAGRGSYPGGPGISAKANTGSGGGAAGGNTGVAPGCSGAAGGYSEKLIVTPAASYSYAVGAKGLAGGSGTSGFNGGDGADGLIIVDVYYD